MSLLLRLAAGVSLFWAVLAFWLRRYVVAADQLTPVVQALANALGITNLVLAVLFWYAAGDPGGRRGIVYGAIALWALRTADALYGLLVLLPAEQAVFSLADLIVSLALLVGLIEALSRLPAAKRSA